MLVFTACRCRPSCGGDSDSRRYRPPPPVPPQVRETQSQTRSYSESKPLRASSHNSSRGSPAVPEAAMAVDSMPTSTSAGRFVSRLWFVPAFSSILSIELLLRDYLLMTTLERIALAGLLLIGFWLTLAPTQVQLSDDTSGHGNESNTSPKKVDFQCEAANSGDACNFSDFNDESWDRAMHSFTFSHFSLLLEKQLRVLKEVARKANGGEDFEPWGRRATDRYLRVLLTRPGKDEAWASQKVLSLLAFRNDIAADRLLPPLTSLENTAGCDHTLHPSVSTQNPPHNAPTAFLPSDKNLAECERLLASGSLYFHGVDIRGRPVLWARSGFVDHELLSREPDAMVRAVQTMMEAGVKWGGDRGAPRFTYIEITSGLDPLKFPVRQGLRLIRGCIDGLLRGGAARGALFLVAPSTMVNRVMLKLTRPFLPASLRKKIRLLASFDALKYAVRLPSAEELAEDDSAFLQRGDTHDDADHDDLDGLARGLGIELPDFVPGGTARHEIPRRSDGRLNLPLMMERVRAAALEQRRTRRERIFLKLKKARHDGTS